MATFGVDQNIGSGDIQFAQQFASKVALNGIVKNPVMKVLVENGCTNVENKLEMDKGGTVTMYTRLRETGTGVSGDVDIYANAQFQDISGRTLNIARVSKPTKWRRKGSQDYQYAPYDLSDGCVPNISNWMTGLVSASVINQICGNNASSITQNALNPGGTFNVTDGTLLQITGNNAAIAPTYWYEASSGGAISTDSGVTSGNVLTIQDFQEAVEVIESADSTRPTWQTLNEYSNEGFIAVAFISRTGAYQMQNQAVTLGQGPQIQNIIQAAMAGGKNVDGWSNSFMIPMIPIKFVIVPDSWMPRGVTTSGLAETANTRRAVIVGANALDVAWGQGQALKMNAGGNPRGNTGTAGSGKFLPGVSVEIDDQHKKLNKETFANASLLSGFKKAQANGLGAQTGTSYDLATYVITHYSAT
jgi:hypothetical protein